jgi:hypothetical protein
LSKQVEHIEKLRKELDKLKEELERIDLTESGHFIRLYTWVGALGKLVEGLHDMAKEEIEVLEFYGKEIEALKEEIKTLKSSK